MGNSTEIKIRKNTVENCIINECISHYEKIKAMPSSYLELIAEVEIVEFDFSLIGHFILFKEESPNLTITIILEKNYANSIDSIDTINNEHKSIVWKLRQQMLHAFYSTGKDIFNLIDGNGEISRASLDKNKKNYFVLSKKFLPLTYLNRENYESLFLKRINFNSIGGLNLDGKKDEEGLYQACRKLLFENNKTLDCSTYLQVLSQLAFYHALEEAKMLRYYLFDQLDVSLKTALMNNEKKEDFQVGTTRDLSEKKRYWTALIKVFDEIKEESPIYVILFFTFISSDLIFKTKEGLSKEADRIIKLWEFTKELIYGINELAKNIVEHANTKKGIIAGFVNSNTELELSVFDHGEMGVMKTFMEGLTEKKNLVKSDLERSLIEEDISAIKDRRFEFKSFFVSGGTHILNDQAYRATAHLGLLFFSKLVMHNDGVLEVVSTNKEYSQTDIFPESLDEERPSIGTYCKIILSLSKSQKYRPYKQLVLPQSESSIERSKTKFFDLVCTPMKVVTDQSDQSNLAEIHVIKPECINDGKEPKLWEQDLWKEIVMQMKTKEYVCIDFFLLWKDDNSSSASQLFRFLGKFELYYPNIQLIIFNIRTELFWELKRINNFYASAYHVDYWNEKKATLVYSYQEIKKNRFYFTDVLWGKNESDFEMINLFISKNNFNLNSIDREESVDIHESDMQNLLKNIPGSLFEDNNLIHFDLLIKDEEENKPLFSFTTETLLNSHIENDTDELKVVSSVDIKKYIERLSRYKIFDTHFRLGSKIHITDFYYAKPLFQNSYFAQRYALLLAYDIIHSGLNGILNSSKSLLINTRLEDAKQILINFKDEDRVKITLIGYGLYSELLICYVKEILENYYRGEVIINTNTVTDAEDCRLNKPDTIIYSNVIIIVPIASTFSTSIKIEKILRGESKSYFKDPYYNVLSVVDKSFEKINGLIPDDSIFKKYGWENIDKRERIVTTVIYDNVARPTVKQKYYIYQTTDWQNVEDCEKCFPDKFPDRKLDSDVGIDVFYSDKGEECKRNHECLDCSKCCALNESPLFVTDNTSLTPELILGMPKAREIELGSIKRKLELTKNTILYGHFERNQNHYHYYFNDYEFWDKNKNKVKDWLETININAYERVVILAPCHFSNAEFVEMVNKVVFGNRAAIIHYDPNIENAQNFEFFYGKEIENAKKIYFVDDVITSGATLLAINSFLKCLDFKKEPELEACFFFVNRSGYYESSNINRICNKIYAFSNLHLPYIKSFNNKCPLCDEQKKYEKLYENSYLTRIKLHFLEQQRKLQKTSIDAKNENINKTDVRKRVEALHRIYALFSKSNEQVLSEYNFDKWVKYLFNATETPFIKSYLEEDVAVKDGCILSESQIAVLKNLTQSPFYNYKKIRKKTFVWINQLLEYKIGHMNGIINGEDGIITHGSLKELKLLIRRASLLNSNYIISYKLLHLLRITYSNIEKDELRTKELQEFSIFFVAQVNELLYNNELRSVELDNRLQFFEQAVSKSKLFRQLIRMLREENAAIVRTFAESFEKSFDRQMKIGDFISQVESCFNAFKNNHLYPSNVDENRIKLFLSLRLRLRNKGGEQEKIDFFANELSEIIGVQPSNEGVFTIVKYKHTNGNPYYLLHNEGATKTHIEHNEDVYLNRERYLMEFLEKGEAPSGKDTPRKHAISSISIIEFHKDEEGKWTDLFAEETCTTNEILQAFPIPPYSNHILLLRIDKDTIEKENETTQYKEADDSSMEKDRDGRKYMTKYSGQALIGFYFIRDKAVLTDINLTRYLLLLREDISHYLTKVVEIDAFRDLVEKEKKNKEYIARYRKNTHSAKMYLDKVAPKLFIENLSGNPNLYAVCADLYIGEIHHSLLVNKRKDFLGVHIYPVKEKLNTSFRNCIIKHLINSGFHKYNISIDVGSFIERKMYYAYETPFLLFQLINNIIAHTEGTQKCNSQISIVTENEYIVIKNSNSKITQDEIEKIRNILQSDDIPYKSISLYVINYFCQYMCDNPRDNKTLIVDIEENHTFVVKIPLLNN